MYMFKKQLEMTSMEGHHAQHIFAVYIKRERERDSDLGLVAGDLF